MAQLKKEHFQEYIIQTRGISEKTMNHYMVALQTINRILSDRNYPISDLFSINSIEELERIKLFLSNDKEFLTKDTVGHRMYSVAFKHYYRYSYRILSCLSCAK